MQIGLHDDTMMAVFVIRCKKGQSFITTDSRRVGMSGAINIIYGDNGCIRNVLNKIGGFKKLGEKFN